MYVEWIRFLLFLFLDRINHSSLKLRPGMQDYQKFLFACGEGLFGRRPHYPKDLVDPVQLFSLR
jgi:hypothetical protein